MKNPLDIPAKERGQLRLFAVNLTNPSDTPTAQTLCDLLGANDLDPTYVELVQISDLDEMSLPQYLSQGYDIDAETLAPDRTRLAALSGYVLIILSLAFRDRALTLRDVPDLTLIASYGADGPDWTSTEAIKTDSTAIGSGAQPRKKPSDAAMGGRVATFALLFMFVFTALFIWLAA
jgi:hypothetical protein